MFATRLARLLSILITSTASVVLPAPIVSPATVAQEASCFVGVDFAAMSHDQLAAVVTEAVQGMPPGTSDADIVAAIGSQIGANAAGCSPEQLAAVAQNVAAVLEELGITVNGNMAQLLLVAMVTPAPPILQGPGVSTVASVY